LFSALKSANSGKFELGHFSCELRELDLRGKTVAGDVKSSKSIANCTFLSSGMALAGAVEPGFPGTQWKNYRCEHFWRLVHGNSCMNIPGSKFLGPFQAVSTILFE